MAFKRSFYRSLLMGTFLLLSEVAVAQVSSVSVQPVITVQAVLQEQGRSYANGTYEITASLYADAAGTQQIWSASYQKQIENGLLNLELGRADQPLPSPTELQGEVWLGISVNGSEELRPLTRLSSAIHALSIADRSVTKEKMATDYVASVSVNGKKIAATGLDLNIVGSDDIKLEYDKASNSIIVKSSNGTITTGGKNGKLNQTTYIKGDLIAQQDVKLGSTSSNTIDFVGKAASDLNMNAKTLTGMTDLTLGTSSSEGVLNLVSDGGGTFSFLAAPSTLDQVITIPEGLDGEMTLMMATTDGVIAPSTGVEFIGSEEDPVTETHTELLGISDTASVDQISATFNLDCWNSNDPDCGRALVINGTSTTAARLLAMKLDGTGTRIGGDLFTGPMHFLSAPGEQPMTEAEGMLIPKEGSTFELGTLTNPITSVSTGSVTLSDTASVDQVTTTMGIDCWDPTDPDCPGAFVISSSTTNNMLAMRLDGTATRIAGSLLTQPMTFFSASSPDGDPYTEAEGTLIPREGTAFELGTLTDPITSLSSTSVTLSDTASVDQFTMGVDCPDPTDVDCQRAMIISSSTGSAGLMYLTSSGDLSALGGVNAGNSLTVHSTSLGNSVVRMYEPATGKSTSDNYLGLTAASMSEDMTLVMPSYIPAQPSTLYAYDVTGEYVSMDWAPAPAAELVQIAHGGIPAGSSLLLEVPAETYGSTSGVVAVSPFSDLPDGLIVAYARVFAEDTVAIKVTNLSGNDIAAGDLDMYVSVTR